MNKIILTTTKSFSGTVEETDLKEKLAAQGVEAVLYDEFKEPFPFDKEKVFAIVAGHTPKGEMLHIGPKEAAFFPKLKIVTPFGVGMNHIDISGLEKMDVTVKTVPHLSRRTVAELAITFFFALARRVVPLTTAIRGGAWERENGANIFGKTLGIIGLGNIGKEVAKMARGIGMEVIANDIVWDDAFVKEWNIKKAEKEEVYQKSDFITLHVPLTELTENMVDSVAFSKMKDGVFFINAARGEVVDEKALLSALESGTIAGAAMDVFTKEPPFKDPVLARLVKHPNTIVTPHIGAFTPETRYAIADHILGEILPK